MKENNSGILRLVIILTSLFILMQGAFLFIHAQVSGMNTSMMKEFNAHVAVLAHFLTPAKFNLIAPIFLFIFLQFFIYAVYIFLLWYTVVSIRELLALNYQSTRYLSYFTWFISVGLIVSGNLFFIPHSYFSQMVQNELLSAPAKASTLQGIFSITLLICLTMLLLALLNAGKHIIKHNRRKRDWTAILLAGLVLFSVIKQPAAHNVLYTPATEQRPNVVILGFDALRPDYLSYFNNHRDATPNFDKFLHQSTVFMQAYTPVARTFPSWLSILTGQYPRHHKGRDDNQDLSTLAVTTTLANQFQQQGYETIFASDDNRFNNINQSRFGFNRLIGPSGNAVDMVVSGMNDLPLSNLIMTTPIGKLLFSEFIGNHGTPQLYEFSDFLPQLQKGLSERDFNKPVFLVAHINSTAWPFFFLQHKVRSNDDLALYKAAVADSDAAFGQIMQTLNQQGLLEHTVFVLLSDHGITLQLPGDRLTTESNYQGDPKQMVVKRTPYRNVSFVINDAKTNPHDDESKIVHITTKEDISSPAAQLAFASKLQSPFNAFKSGVDTSWGYGTDILSLTQNHSLLAMRFFGKQVVKPHQVNDRVLTIDIAPTVLDVLGLHAMPQTDGISLKSAILSKTAQIKREQPFYFETSFTIPEMEHGGIQVSQVLSKTMSLYQINPENALLSVIPSAEEIAIKNKQRSIISGDWLLAYYPASERYRYDPESGKFDRYIQKPYTVLMNLKTGKWTTNLQPVLANAAPAADLVKQIHAFYGDEMQTYKQ